MATIKEFREFFLRHIKVTSGTKPDQEVNFPTQYYIGTTLVYNRFLKNDYPSESIFKKLYESLTFKLNKEDTAKLSEQGLVKIATDAQAKARSSNATSDYTAAVVPHQLPEVILTSVLAQDVNIGSAETTTGMMLQLVERTIAGLSRYVYKLSVAVDKSITIASEKVQLVNDAATPGASKYYGTNGAGTKGWFGFTTDVQNVAMASSTPAIVNIATNQLIPDAIATITVAGSYLIIYEADIIIPTNAFVSTYRLVKNGATTINDNRLIQSSLTTLGDYMSGKIYCTALATLAISDTVQLSLDSDANGIIAGRSITVIKIG